MEPLSLFLVSIVAGAFGAMLGLGGGIILVPALTLLFHVPMNSAVAASLVSIVVTSCVGVQTYLRAGWTDVRLGVQLLLPMVAGAIAGVWLSALVSPQWIAGLFIMLIFYILFQMIRAGRRQTNTEEEQPHEVVIQSLSERILVTALSTLAGIISALLGVGGGLIQVPMMNGLLRAPLKQAIGTSSFLIGMTAAVSALIYLARGVLQPDLVVPCTFGIFVGARLGTQFGLKMPPTLLRILFAVVMVITALRMFQRWFL
jgi:uncharacterized membrane protein YfcA